MLAVDPFSESRRAGSARDAEGAAANGRRARARRSTDRVVLPADAVVRWDGVCVGLL